MEPPNGLDSYVDADCDMLVPGEAGSLGNMAGMAGTHLTLRPGALESMKPFSRPDGSGVVDSENVVFFGLNYDSPANKPQHLANLLDEHFRVFTKQTVAINAKGAAEAALKWLEERVDYIHVHLDVDAIDPGKFPLCNVPKFYWRWV
jgi:arginase